MKHWKFLLLGITGHLSATKILPALAQFAELNQEKVSISLIGFSRSQPDVEKIINILNQFSTDKKHKLVGIDFIQGEYENPDYFFNLVSNLDIDQKLIAYLAVPPKVFIHFLRNACPYTEKDFEIIMEKPFGNSLSEAQEIFKVIETCSMSNKVHFFDHYMFKTPTILSSADKQNFKNLGINENKKIFSLSVSALEDQGVAGRGGYYQTAGALKDMLPHLISLANCSLDAIGYPNQFSFQISNDISQDFTFISGQYQDYTTDVNVKSSNIETYFKLKTKIEFQLNLESGKQLPQKTTSLQIMFTDGASINWQIYPEKKLIIKSGDDYFEINLNKDNKLDHTNMLEAIYAKDYSRFVKKELILAGWQMYQSIFKLAKVKNIKPKIYVAKTYPLQFI